MFAVWRLNSDQPSIENRISAFAELRFCVSNFRCTATRSAVVFGNALLPHRARTVRMAKHPTRRIDAVLGAELADKLLPQFMQRLERRHSPRIVKFVLAYNPRFPYDLARHRCLRTAGLPEG